MRYFKKIPGQRLYLSPINSDDTEIYVKWLNDSAVSGWLGGMYTKMISLANEGELLKKLASSGHSYAIVLNDGDRLIGNTGLNNIDYVFRTAEAGIFIGDDEQRGQGYGSEALRLLLGYAFDKLNLHNIMLWVHSDNERAIACYKKIGFKEIGRRRQSRYDDGRYYDSICMDMLRGELQ